MVNAVTHALIDVAKAFALDPNADVTCPVCRNSKLFSEDIAVPSGEVVERRLYCTNCGAENYLRLGPQTREQ